MGASISILLSLLIALGVVIMTFLAVGIWLSGPVYSGPVSDHFNGKRFFTPHGQPAKGLADVFRWMFNRQRTPWKENSNAPPGAKPPERVEKGVRITFVNHSTFLIQADGLNFLTDPVWSKRVSPFQWAGPQRLRPPGIRFADLPKIDIVLLSHNHYDHMDVATLRNIQAVHQPRVITTLGVKACLEKEKITNAIELDWWQTTAAGSAVRVQAVPAQHFAGRGTLDRDGTLWCGFVIMRKDGNIYFAGDSGYNEFFFKEIGARCAPLETALIPIGAYKPMWFMSPIHCSPSEAVHIHQDIRVKQSIATHFGTFQLADDGKEEPVEALRKALAEKQLPETAFIVLNEGEAHTSIT